MTKQASEAQRNREMGGEVEREREREREGERVRGREKGPSMEGCNPHVNG